jgi:hypothetical protein
VFGREDETPRSVDNLYSVPSSLLAFLSGFPQRVLVADSTLLGHGHENVQTWKKSRKSTTGRDYSCTFNTSRSQLVTSYAPVIYFSCWSHDTHVPVWEAQTLGPKFHPSVIKGNARTFSYHSTAANSAMLEKPPSLIVSLEAEPHVAPIHPLRSPKAECAVQPHVLQASEAFQKPIIWPICLLENG